MSTGWMILFGSVLLGAAVYWLDLQLKRRRGHRSLSQGQPAREKSKLTPNAALGTEAINLDLVDEANRENARGETINDEATSRSR